MSIRHTEPLPRPAGFCFECGGTGTVWDWDADGTKVRTPCPGLAHRNPTRERMAREFGTDSQRERIRKERQWR